jgi:hypothetical protein
VLLEYSTGVFAGDMFVDLVYELGWEAKEIHIG